MKSEDLFSQIEDPKIFNHVKNVINMMTPDPVFGTALNKMIDEKLVETRCVVSWAAQYLQAKNYLEIGVRWGWSLGVVAAALPKCEIYGFDIWETNYPNNMGSNEPCPEFVSAEIKKLGYEKELHLISGNSHQTVPMFFKENPNLEFDLILVDGDHSDGGALDDLQNTMPHIRVGGILLFDDIVLNPNHGGHLDKVFDKLQTLYPNFEYHTYSKNEPGIGIAIRLK